MTVSGIYQTLLNRLTEIKKLVEENPKKKNAYVWEQIFIVVSLFFIFFLIALIPFLTRFYPFSLLFRGDLRHYKFRKIREFIDILEKNPEGRRLELKVESIDWNNNSLYLYLKDLRERDNAEHYIKFVSSKYFQTDPHDIRVRDVKSGFLKVSLPGSLL